MTKLEKAIIAIVNVSGDTIVAKPKKAVIVKVVNDDTVLPILQIWANDLLIEDILSVEGISNVMCFENHPWLAYTDARYDAHEIAEELEELLSASVPNVFKESNVFKE